MAGAVSAGMCAALEALGLVDRFDVIYGSSAGALNASYLAAGQARLRAPLYVLAARQGMFDLRNAAMGRPPLRLADLGTRLLERHPHDPSVLDAALRVTAADLERKTLEVLSGFASVKELRTAVWASCANPVLTADVIDFRGRLYVDGGLIESPSGSRCATAPATSSSCARATLVTARPCSGACAAAR